MFLLTKLVYHILHKGVLDPCAINTLLYVTMPLYLTNIYYIYIYSYLIWNITIYR